MLPNPAKSSGDTVSVFGANFGHTAGSVLIGGAACSVLTWNDTLVRCISQPTTAPASHVEVVSSGQSSAASEAAVYVLHALVHGNAGAVDTVGLCCAGTMSARRSCTASARRMDRQQAARCSPFPELTLELAR